MIHNNRVIALLVVAPGLLRHNFVWAPISVWLVYVWLLADPIQVLVQPIQQEDQQFLAVVLLVPAELGRIVTHSLLECPRRDIPYIALHSILSLRMSSFCLLVLLNLGMHMPTVARMQFARLVQQYPTKQTYPFGPHCAVTTYLSR